MCKSDAKKNITNHIVYQYFVYTLDLVSRLNSAQFVKLVIYTLLPYRHIVSKVAYGWVIL